jgi:hypothetical protein
MKIILMENRKRERERDGWQNFTMQHLWQIFSFKERAKEA